MKILNVILIGFLGLFVLSGCGGYDLEPTITKFKIVDGQTVAEEVQEDPRISAHRMQTDTQKSCYKAQEAKYIHQDFSGMDPNQVLLRIFFKIASKPLAL